MTDDAWLTFSMKIRHPDGSPLVARRLDPDDLATLVRVLFGHVEGVVLVDDIHLTRADPVRRR